MARLFSPVRRNVRWTIRLCGAYALMAALLCHARAELKVDGSNLMAPAPTGMVETGAPSFAVLGADALGLSAPPLDLRFLPDGRILAIGRRELAFGDGVRWQTFRAADDSVPMPGRVAVAEDGQIYFGIEGGIARVEFGADARWRAIPTVRLPSGSRLDGSTMIAVDQVGDDWYWHAGSGAIVGWQPGRNPRVAGTVGAIERIFAVDRDLFVSEQASGGLYRLTSRSANVERIAASAQFASETVTATVPFAPGVVLVGTSLKGLKLFDGANFLPFNASGPLGGGHRINDLCRAGPDLFAAAVDTAGIVFFDRTGRIVQVLARSLDHRLGRTQRLLYADNGVLWALLNEGVARVEFPSAISWFEPLIASGLAYAKPVRHAGQLWLLADGRAMAGVYDATQRLVGFEADMPNSRYVFALGEVDGTLFATNEHAIYLRRDDRWELVADGIVNARMLGALPGGGLLYIARNEVGVLEPTPDGYRSRRKSVPQMGDAYNQLADASGVYWIELGSSRVGRLDPRAPDPAIEIFTSSDGLADGWVEAFLFDGVARFRVSNHLFRFDAASRRFVPDQELLRRYPELAAARGRSATDPQGRVWYSAEGKAHVIEGTGAERTVRDVPVGFAPTEYTVEEDGVVWMFYNRRLSRVDLRMPSPPAPAVHAVVTAVQFAATNRHLFAPGASIEPVDYTENSVVFHFAAPANPFGAALTFDVLLEGAGGQWISTGNVGSAAFNRLKEGDYIFHVRPVIAGKASGQESSVAFTIRPPWFRTPLAWTLYGATGLGLLGFSIWLPAWLQRRENARLEQLVAVRTEELNTSNQQLGRQIQETIEKSQELAASEERYRQLNVELEHRVETRTAELSLSNVELQQRESLFRLMFEHAPVGIAWKRSDLGDEYHFNATFRRILQLPVNAPSDYTTIRRLVHADDDAALTRAERSIQSGHADSFNVEPRFVVPGGRTVWTSLSVAVVRGPDGAIVQEISILEDTTARKKAEQELATTYKNVVDASRMAGMAEVATGVLHNVGNVLNSLNVSTNLVANGVRQAKVDTIVKLSAMLDEHASDLGVFLTQDPKGRLVPEMLAKLAQHSVAERDWLAKEVASMQKNIDHIKDIVAMQQSYATVIGVVETLEPSTLFEDALRMNTAALMRHDVTVNREYLPTPHVSVEKGKVLQILINLIRNAKYACDDAQLPEGTQKIMTVRIEPGENGRVRLIVRDNGVGIAPENLTRIFAHGFTTRSYGHGFGLHSSAIAAKEMQGSLTAYSEGLGRGATFVLEIPAEQSSSSASTRSGKTVLTTPPVEA